MHDINLKLLGGKILPNTHGSDLKHGTHEYTDAFFLFAFDGVPK